jgi:hypothetical protein
VAIACPVTGELVVVLAGPSSAQGRGGPGAVDLSEQLLFGTVTTDSSAAMLKNLKLQHAATS